MMKSTSAVPKISGSRVHENGREMRKRGYRQEGEAHQSRHPAICKNTSHTFVTLGLGWVGGGWVGLGWVGGGWVGGRWAGGGCVVCGWGWVGLLGAMIRGRRTRNLCVCFRPIYYWRQSLCSRRDVRYTCSQQEPPGVTQERVNTGAFFFLCFFLPRRPPAVLAFIFISRRIRPSLSLVNTKQS